jgi:hypothetical protein
MKWEYCCEIRFENRCEKQLELLGYWIKLRVARDSVREHDK